MNTNRQDDRVFRYVRAILSTRRPGTGVPVVFGLTKVSKAIDHFTDYLKYVLTNTAEPRTGELKRAVREVFEGIGNSSIDDGTVPRLDGTRLSSAQVAELGCLLLSLEEKIPSASRRNWREDISSWSSFVIQSNAVRGDLWEGVKRTSFARSGNSKLIYRMFLLVSGITRGTRFDPTQLADATLPQANGHDAERFRNSASRDPDFLDADIRSKIWSGFQEEQNPHFLAAGVPKPSRRPRSAETMLEMFDCYFNCRAYTYDQQALFIEAGKTLRLARTISVRYWPMIGSIAIGPIICTNLLFGCGALVTLLVLWRHQRQSETSPLYAIPHWGPHSATAYAALCALFVGNSPWLAIITAIPVSIFAAHLGRNWENLRAAA